MLLQGPGLGLLGLPLAGGGGVDFGEVQRCLSSQPGEGGIPGEVVDAWCGMALVHDDPGEDVDA